MKSTSMIVLAGLIVVVLGCKKVENEEPDKRKLLTAHNWTYYQLFRNDTNITEESLNYDSNWIFTFKDNDSLDVTLPTTYILPYIWHFENNQEVLVMTLLNFTTIKWKILKLNNSEFWTLSLPDDSVKYEYHLKPSP